jgi:hypothetical protein
MVVDYLTGGVHHSGVRLTPRQRQSAALRGCPAAALSRWGWGRRRGRACQPFTVTDRSTFASRSVKVEPGTRVAGLLVGLAHWTAWILSPNIFVPSRAVAPALDRLQLASQRSTWAALTEAALSAAATAGTVSSEAGPGPARRALAATARAFLPRALLPRRRTARRSRRRPRASRAPRRRSSWRPRR